MENRYTFTDLFSKQVDFDKDTKVTISSIVIPQIQRPYAQGRTDGVSTYIRNTFLDDIFETLTGEGNGILDLNFIYGIIKPENDEYRMELLDGQQRMTTLFLLYWYIVNAELDVEQPESESVRDCLSRFVYETRSTSTVFCNELAMFKADLTGKTPKEVIRQSKWYFKSFDRDSTISAMLTMLDAIHERYSSLGSRCLFGKLQNIQFYVKSLGVFNLSEELYIKMNARGLQLSPFENFKADLTNFISKRESVLFGEPVPLYNDDSGMLVPQYMNFSVKMDTKWVDIFWKNGSEDFDDAYMSFFSRFFACKYIIASKNSVNEKDMRSDKNIRIFYTDAEEQLGSNEYFGFKAFEKLLDKHPEYIFTLEKMLDTLYSHDHLTAERIIFRNMLPVWEKSAGDDGDDFYCNTATKMSQTKLIALAAVIEYVEAMENFDAVTFGQWMRVVWNIIENTNIDSLTPVTSLIRKFSAIIHFVADRMKEDESFYAALSRWRTENANDKENRALLEEVEKARRIAEDPEWERIWKEVEKHPYFKGMATFFYTPSMTKEEYIKSAGIAKGMFGPTGITEEYTNEHILIRAIVSRHSSWEEINELYITERSEKNKYLKNILAANTKVRTMLADAVRHDSAQEVKATLKRYIDEAEEPTVWQNADQESIEAFEMATYRLRHDTRIYDWIAQQEPKEKGTFRVYWYKGHIMFAIPRKQFAKVALDTERGSMAKELCNAYGFRFDDRNQEAMYDEYGDCFGNEVWVWQERSECTVWVRFEQHRIARIAIECNTKRLAKELLDSFDGSWLYDEDEKWISLPELRHTSKEKSFKDICNAIEKVFETISPLPSQCNA